MAVKGLAGNAQLPAKFADNRLPLPHRGHDENDVRDDLLPVVLWTDGRRLLFLVYGSEGVAAVQRIRRLYESFRVVSVSMGQGLGFAAISEARARACVSI